MTNADRKKTFKSGLIDSDPTTPEGADAINNLKREWHAALSHFVILDHEDTETQLGAIEAKLKRAGGSLEPYTDQQLQLLAEFAVQRTCRAWADVPGDPGDDQILFIIVANLIYHNRNGNPAQTVALISQALDEYDARWTLAT